MGAILETFISSWIVSDWELDFQQLRNVAVKPETADRDEAPPTSHCDKYMHRRPKH